MFHLAIICGGPSGERGISLNSARSLMDHLSHPQITIHPIYVDLQKNFYKLSCAQLYSNTPFDFDFKLNQTAQKLSTDELIYTLKSVNLTFPTIHGAFGEDGELIAFLEGINVPFVGHSSITCKNMFNKHLAAAILKTHHYPTIPSILVEDFHSIKSFFEIHSLNKAVIKPTAGGSSIGVSVVTTPEETQKKASEYPGPMLLEPFCQGKEFTIVLIQNPDGTPVALIPTEIEISYENNQFFNYRRKYLPTANTFYHTPPRFSFEIIKKIQSHAEALFNLFQMRDFARLDGWLLDDGTLYFSDFNPISGMEQNSFLFRQAALCGMSHKQVLLNILHNACQRYNIPPPPASSPTYSNNPSIFVLFGNNTAERQVSLMTGTNVWHKLRQSQKYTPYPFFLDKDKNIWSLPYAYALNHTVEEIYHNCLIANSFQNQLLSLQPSSQRPQDLPLHNSPKKYTLEAFLQLAKAERAFVFLGLHGDIGEDGTLQQLLQNHDIPYNGSPPLPSALCMDKFQTGLAINALNNKSLLSLPKKTLTTQELLKITNPNLFWDQLTCDLQSQTLIIKPRSDGCSTGIVKLLSSIDLSTYIYLISHQSATIPPHTFSNQPEFIELSLDPTASFIFEPYIQTDSISINNNTLSYTPKTGWLELTVCVLENNHKYHALNPSITIASNTILSLEEKFQGGTGINLTPPPPSIIPLSQVNQIKKSIELAAQTLGITNYARIDIFFNILSSTTLIIEANTLPALTPSTVIYHQALAESPPLSPTTFLETIISNKLQETALMHNQTTNTILSP